MNKEIDKLIKDFAEAKKQMKEAGEKALKKAFRVFFEQNPCVKSVVWTQYTPYFNDGDTCTFGVHEAEVKVKYDLLPDDTKQKCEKEFANEEDMEDYQYGEACIINLLAGFNNKAKKLSEFEKQLVDSYDNTISDVFKLGDVLQDVFGDHVQIVAQSNPEKFVVEDYEHE